MTGVPPERVMLLKAKTTNGWSVGSGTLVSSSLILTAAHVVFDHDGSPLTEIVVGQAHEQPVNARVIWPDSYCEGTDPVALDAAVVEVTDPSWNPPLLSAVRWGRLTGRQVRQECAATGFPRVLRDPDGTRDSDQVAAFINPGSRRVAGRYDLHVLSAVPAELQGDSSPWAGLSGAGVFANGLLIGVIVDEHGGYSGGRLSAVPVHRLAADRGFTDAISTGDVGFTGPRNVHSVELNRVLRPVDLPESRPKWDNNRSPATLLRPEMEVVPFHGRDEFTRALTSWCTDNTIGVGVRLIIGPGGQGKTRFARHLAGMLLEQSASGPNAWVCGFLTPDGDEQDLALLGEVDGPVLIIVDYAEARVEQLKKLLLPLRRSTDASQHVRVILLARAAGEWWTTLDRELDCVPGEVLTLASLGSAEDRGQQFSAAVVAFAKRGVGLQSDGEIRARAVIAPMDIADARYGSPLTLQLAALTELLEADGHVSSPCRTEPAEKTLLRHEERYWNDTAHFAGLNLSERTLREVVSVATLCGARSFDDVSTLLGAVPGARDVSADTMRRLDTWLTGLYPSEAGQRWAGLQPDRLGEYLVADTLLHEPSLLHTVLNRTCPAQHHRALTILSRALGNPALSVAQEDRLFSQVHEALASRLELLARPAMKVITETSDPVRLLSALRKAAGTADPATIAKLVSWLPSRSLALADLAEMLTASLVAHHRGRAQEVQTTKSDLAGMLNNLSVRLTALGRREEALAASEESVNEYRKLANANPNTYRPVLAIALNNLSNRLSALERREDALEAIEESVELTRQSGADERDRYRPDRARALNSLSIRLSAVGRREKALDASKQSVNEYRKLANADPNAYRPDLASALNNFSSHLSAMDRREKALKISKQSVNEYRTLANANPDTYRPDLAGALNNLSNRLSALDRRDEALAASQESVAEYRTLAEAHPDVYRPILARALNNLSNRLADMDRREDAASVLKQARAIAENA